MLLIVGIGIGIMDTGNFILGEELLFKKVDVFLW